MRHLTGRPPILRFAHYLSKKFVRAPLATNWHRTIHLEIPDANHHTTSHMDHDNCQRHAHNIGRFFNWGTLALARCVPTVAHATIIIFPLDRKIVEQHPGVRPISLPLILQHGDFWHAGGAQTTHLLQNGSTMTIYFMPGFVTKHLI